MSDYPLSGAYAPIIDLHDFMKSPQVVFDQNGLVVKAVYYNQRDAAGKACWILLARFGSDEHTYEGEWEYEIPETQEIRQFAGECIVRAWNEGRLEVKV